MATVLILPYRPYYSLMAAVGESGYRVVEAHDSGDMLRLASRRSTDLAIIPDDATPVEGEELLPAIRRLTPAAIIVVGTGGEVKMANPKSTEGMTMQQRNGR